MQQNKQQLSAMKRKVGDTGVEELRPGEPPAKINSRWTNDELLMAVRAVRKYGKGLPISFIFPWRFGFFITIYFSLSNECVNRFPRSWVIYQTGIYHNVDDLFMKALYLYDSVFFMQEEISKLSPKH